MRVTDIDSAVAARVRELRRRRNLSQQVFAKAIGVSPRQLRKYENGEDRLSAGRLHAITQELGCSFNDLFLNTGGKPSHNGTGKTRGFQTFHKETEKKT